MFEDNKQFMKGFDLNKNKFFNGYVPLKPVTYCVIVVYDNNFRKEIYGVENPWQLINGLKKNPKVKSAYIKDEIIP